MRKTIDYYVAVDYTDKNGTPIYLYFMGYGGRGKSGRPLLALTEDFDIEQIVGFAERGQAEDVARNISVHYEKVTAALVCKSDMVLVTYKKGVKIEPDGRSEKY